MDGGGAGGAAAGGVWYFSAKTAVSWRLFKFTGKEEGPPFNLLFQVVPTVGRMQPKNPFVPMTTTTTRRSCC